MERIVVAIDVSEASLRAVDFAADLAGKCDAELVLLTVAPEIVGRNPDLEAYAHLEHIQEPVSTMAVESLRDGLADICERATTKGARHVTAEAVVGDPGEQILAFAAAHRADLIALGSRGHGRLVGLLLGSVAQKVVALAKCAVLVVH